jgi:hypothetical protein
MDLRYPIGPYDIHHRPSATELDSAIEAIGLLPAELEAVLAELERRPAALDAPYRPGGWTRRQVVHHLADSHANATIRTRLTLTEDVPTVKPYDEVAWAELVDAATAQLEPSVLMLRGIHRRWSMLLASLPAAAFERRLRHPEHGELTLAQLIASYGWHCRHHLAHLGSAWVP